jgi:glycosyltransferase involved in cell wall biosynthesis
MSVSVIIPVYNEEKETLNNTIASLQRQHLDMELIVVDDGSDVPVEVEGLDIVRIEHKGAGAARNEGLKRAKMDYVFFLDADTVLMPGSLEFMRTALEGTPNADFAYAKYLWHDGTSPAWHLCNPGMQWRPDILKVTNYIGSMSMVRRGAFGLETDTPILFDEELRKYQDWDLWLQFMEAGMIGIGLDTYIAITLKREGITSTEKDLPWRTYINMKHQIPRVGIFMLTRDRADYTRRTLESLEANAGYPYDLVIVDNGSVEQQPFNDFNIKGLWKFNENRGLKMGCRKGIDMLMHKEYIPYDYVMKLDNDADCKSEGFLRDLVEGTFFICNRFNNPFVAVSPKITGLNHEPVRLDTICMQGINISSLRHIGGICCMSTSDAWLNFRELDYQAFKAKGQDVAFTEMLKELNGKSYYLEDIEIEHMDTTAGQAKKYPEYFERKVKEENTIV